VVEPEVVEPEVVEPEVVQPEVGEPEVVEPEVVEPEVVQPEVRQQPSELIDPKTPKTKASGNKRKKPEDLDPMAEFTNTLKKESKKGCNESEPGDFGLSVFELETCAERIARQRRLPLGVVRKQCIQIVRGELVRLSEKPFYRVSPFMKHQYAFFCDVIKQWDPNFTVPPLKQKKEPKQQESKPEPKQKKEPKQQESKQARTIAGCIPEGWLTPTLCDRIAKLLTLIQKIQFETGTRSREKPITLLIELVCKHLPSDRVDKLMGRFVRTCTTAMDEMPVPKNMTKEQYIQKLLRECDKVDILDTPEKVNEAIHRWSFYNKRLAMEKWGQHMRNNSNFQNGNVTALGGKMATEAELQQRLQQKRLERQSLEEQNAGN
jgi:hypothetical protein